MSFVFLRNSVENSTVSFSNSYFSFLIPEFLIDHLSNIYIFTSFVRCRCYLSLQINCPINNGNRTEWSPVQVGL